MCSQHHNSDMSLTDLQVYSWALRQERRAVLYAPPSSHHQVLKRVTGMNVVNISQPYQVGLVGPASPHIDERMLLDLRPRVVTQLTVSTSSCRKYVNSIGPDRTDTTFVCFGTHKGIFQNVHVQRRV